MRETGNLKLASKLLGHADVTTTARYAPLEDFRAGIEAVAKFKFDKNHRKNHWTKQKGKQEKLLMV